MASMAARGEPRGELLPGLCGSCCLGFPAGTAQGRGLRSAVQVKAHQDPCRVIAVVFSVAKKLQTSIEY